MRRSLASFLVLLTVSVCVPPVLAAEGQSFSDIPSSSPYATALAYLKAKDVIDGHPDGTFRPTDKVNRAEAAKMLVRSLGLPTASGATLPFRDTRDRSAWYLPYVGAAYQAGIVQGYPDRTYRPTRTIIRVEGIKMVLSAYKADLSDPAALSTLPYPDAVASSWYQPFLSYASSKNLLDPVAHDRFGVAEPLSRGEFAELLYRLLYIREKGLAAFAQAEEGVASFYGPGFYGRKTSSGTVFSAGFPMAAHKTLPFGTIVEVVSAKTGAGTLVQIQDRGPFVEGRVVDLNEPSFARLAPLSTGVVPVRLAVRSTAPLMTRLEIPTDAFLDEGRAFGVRLDRPLPAAFIENGIHVVTGTVARASETVTAVVRNKATGYESSTEAPVQDGKFSLQIRTPVAGSYTLSVLPGNLGVGEEAITVLPQKTFDKLAMAASARAPSGVSATYDGGEPRLAWKANGNSLFRIRIGGSTVYVSGADSFRVPSDAFPGAVGGATALIVEGAVMDGINPLTLRSGFAASEPLAVNVAKDEYRVHDRDAVSVELGSYFHDGSSIVVRGTAKREVWSEAWYTLPSGRTGSLALADGDTLAAGSAFTFTLPVSEPGTYIIEINGLDHEAVYNVALYPRGTFPVLENDRDHADRTGGRGIKDAVTESSAVLAEINRERQRVGVAPLRWDATLAALAAERSQDMVRRDYISHTTPDGKTLEDLVRERGLSGVAGENIALDSNVAAALQGLLRSPAHRHAILSPEFTAVGLGFAENRHRQVLVTQIFSGP